MITETRFCPECEMEYNWQPVEAEGDYYCCIQCAEGELCRCEPHAHVSELIKPEEE
jgi:hypothetical protein